MLTIFASEDEELVAMADEDKNREGGKQGAQGNVTEAQKAQAAGGDNGASGNGNGPGTPGDAVKAFLQASVKWPDETGDPNVSLAFLMGWRMWRAVTWPNAPAQGQDQ